MLPRLSRRGVAVARGLALALTIVEALILARLYLPRLLSTPAQPAFATTRQCPVRPLVNTPFCPLSAAPTVIAPVWAPITLRSSCPGCLACPPSLHTSPLLTPAGWGLADSAAFSATTIPTHTLASDTITAFTPPSPPPPFTCGPTQHLALGHTHPTPLTSDPEADPQDHQAHDTWLQQQHTLLQTDAWQCEWSVQALMQPGHDFLTASASMKQHGHATAAAAGRHVATQEGADDASASFADAGRTHGTPTSEGPSAADVTVDSEAHHDTPRVAGSVSALLSSALLAPLLGRPAQPPSPSLIHPKSTAARLLSALPPSLQPSALLDHLPSLPTTLTSSADGGMKHIATDSASASPLLSNSRMSPGATAVALVAAACLLAIARLGAPLLAQAMVPSTPHTTTAAYRASWGSFAWASASGSLLSRHRNTAHQEEHALGTDAAQAQPWWQFAPSPAGSLVPGTGQGQEEGQEQGEGARRLSFPAWLSPWSGRASMATTPASMRLSPVSLGSLRGVTLPSPLTMASPLSLPSLFSLGVGSDGRGGGSSGVVGSAGRVSSRGGRPSTSPLGLVLAALSPVELAPPSPGAGQGQEEEDAGAPSPYFGATWSLPQEQEQEDDVALAVARELLQGGSDHLHTAGGSPSLLQLLPETQDQAHTAGQYAHSPHLPGAPASSSPTSSLLGMPGMLSAAKAMVDMLPSPLSGVLTGSKAPGSRYNTRNRSRLTGGTPSQSLAVTGEGARDSDGPAESEAVSRHTPGSTVKAVANGLLGSAQKAGRILTRSARKTTRQLDAVLDDERPGDQDWEWTDAPQDLGAVKTQEADAGRTTRGSRRTAGR